MSEFHRQKAFWERCSWGGIDDIMAMHHRAYVMNKTGGKINTEVPDLKRMAFSIGTFKEKVVETTKSIRAAFMSIASVMKGRK